MYSYIAGYYIFICLIFLILDSKAGTITRKKVSYERNPMVFIFLKKI